LVFYFKNFSIKLKKNNIVYRRNITRKKVVFCPFFPSNIIYNFLIAFGVIVGASLFAGLGALINDHPP